MEVYIAILEVQLESPFNKTKTYEKYLTEFINKNKQHINYIWDNIIVYYDLDVSEFYKPLEFKDFCKWLFRESYDYQLYKIRTAM